MKIYSAIKNKLKSNLSDRNLENLKTIREIVSYLPNCAFDIIRYAHYSSTFLNKKSKEKLRAMLIKNFHIVEKGLSLDKPRPGFGQPVIKKLLWQITTYLDTHGPDEVIRYAVNALKSYQKFNKEHEVKLDLLDTQLKSIEASLHDLYNTNEGGTLQITREQILSRCNGNFKELAANRFSIRVFNETPVSEELIKEAANIARKSPSVCNRQTTRIYSFSTPEQKKSLLALQNGNRGFGHLASHVIAITSDLQCFTGTGERHQAYVDGGLMAMSFVYALQSLGIGSCFLNWSVTADIDERFRRISGIPKSHVIVTLIAIGNIPEKLNIAESPRLPVNEILINQ